MGKNIINWVVVMKDDENFSIIIYIVFDRSASA